MNTRPLLVMTLLLSACAPEPLGAVQSSVQARARPVAAGASTAPQPPGDQGNIVGKIATSPWHAIKDGGVVYLEDGPVKAGVSLSTTLDNHDMAFDPSIAVITAGGFVIFTNTDPIIHNVFSPDGATWNVGQIPPRSSTVKRFETPGTYAVLCNLHPSMLAYLVVTPSTYFARTDADGAFAIKDVPSGTYHVTAWVPRLKPVTQAVALGGGEVTVNFELAR
jgi:plastocyanin